MYLQRLDTTMTVTPEHMFRRIFTDAVVTRGRLLATIRHLSLAMPSDPMLAVRRLSPALFR
jgi:hypothetical protein